MTKADSATSPRVSTSCDAGRARALGRTGSLLAAALALGLLAAAPARGGCIVDIQGADDEPGQKDVSVLCEPGATCSSSSTMLSLSWQLDDVSWTGSNTGDVCALFDVGTDDGLADGAVCVTVFGAAKMAGKCSNDQFVGCIKNQDCGSGGTCILPVNNTGARGATPVRTTDRPGARTLSPSPAPPMQRERRDGADPFKNTVGHTATKCNGGNCVSNDVAVNCCLTASDVGRALS
jgi:hypothetical protein